MFTEYLHDTLDREDVVREYRTQVHWPLGTSETQNKFHIEMRAINLHALRLLTF